jgi:hypothetical protein
MKLGVIYTIADPDTNLVRYIGQTINFNARKRKHLSTSKDSKTYCQCWIFSLLKKGITPIFEIIEECNIDLLDNQEQFYISLFKSWGFDLTNLTNGGFRNKELSIESKKKISDKLKGKIQSEITKLKRSQTLKKVWEDEGLKELKRGQSTLLNKQGLIGTKGKTSKNKGKPFTGDKNKLSISLTNYWSSDEIRNNESKLKGSKMFNIFELGTIKKGNRWGKGSVEKGALLESHYNISYISKKYGIEKNHIRRCLKGNLLQIKNKIFEYENNTN